MDIVQPASRGHRPRYCSYQTRDSEAGPTVSSVEQRDDNDSSNAGPYIILYMRKWHAQSQDRRI